MTRRVALAALLVALCGALAWPVCRQALATWQGHAGDLERATAIAPADARAAGAMAMQQLVDGDAVAAEAHARRAIAAAPMDDRGWPALGLALAAQGRAAEAEIAMRHAVRVAPRSKVAQGWLLGEALDARDADALAAPLDAFLRVEPAGVEAVAPRLAAWIGTEPGFALRPILAARPPWRSALWAQWWQQAGRSHVFHAFLSSLATDAQLTRREALVWSEALQRDGRLEQLAWLWRQGTVEDGAPDEALITDGGFASPPAGYGLGWRLHTVAGATAVFSSGSGPEPGQAAFVLRFAGQRVPYEHLQQMLRLPPGRRVLHYQVRADGLRTAHGLHWQLVCLPNGPQLGASTPHKGRFGWRSAEFAFEVPAEGCATQYLVLRLRALGPSDQWAAGSIRFAGLAIQPRG